jgi:TonB family protein
MTSLAQALSAALLHFVWQGALVGVLLWVALLILRNRPAAVRYNAACAALAILAVLPVVTTYILYESPALPATGADFLVAGAGTPLTIVNAGAVPWLRSLQPWALPVWSLGVFLLSLRLILSSLQVYRLRRRGEPAGSNVLQAVDAVARRLELTRPLRVLISSLADGPAVIGWLRPVILLPSATLLGLTAQQLEAVLAHELAHIRRCDYLVNLLQMAVETLLFYHPAVWWISSRIRLERELCCDDLAVASCGDPLGYARALTRLERLRIAVPAMALGSTGGPLAYRIQRLIGAGTRGYGCSKLPGIFALIAGLACFAVNIHWAQGQEQPAQSLDAHRAEEKQMLEKKLMDEQRAREGGTSPAGSYTFIRHSADSVKVDTAGAAVLHRTGIEYPHVAMEKHIEGTVVIEATLDPAGNVDDARVLSGPAELRKAALQSVLQWHFVAGASGVSRVVKIDFKLPAAEDTVSVAYTPSARTEIDQERSERIRLLEKQMAEARSREAAAQDGTSKEHAKYEAERVLEKLRHDMTGPASLEGSTLSAVRVEGLSDQLRSDLEARIPVHVGELLSKESIERIATSVRQFDEHLEVRLKPRGQGQSELVIVAPAGGHFEYHITEPERVRK